MANSILRQKAIDDLNAIWFYTCSKWSESQADKYYTKIKNDCFLLAENPKMGKNYDNIKKNLLGLKSGKHIIFYQAISENEVEIIRILHEQMDLQKRMED